MTEQEYKQQLINAVEALRSRPAPVDVSSLTDEQLEARIRRGPFWATLGASAPAPGEYITDEVLETLIRNHQIAKALGIKIAPAE